MIIGRGTTDNSLAVWMGALPYCMEIITSVEKFAGKFFTTSEQHVELRTSREKIDRDDFLKFKNWLLEHNPFDDSKTELYSISSGVVAASIINCDKAEEVGMKCLKDVIGKNFEEIKLSTACKVKPLGFSMKSIKLNGQDIIINPHQLFHRMLTVMPSVDKLKESFNYELASSPLSIFDDSGIRQHNPSPLFDYFDKIKGQSNIAFTDKDSDFFVSGDFILGQVAWSSAQTFGEIIEQYVQHILHYYGRMNVRIFFNGSTRSYDFPSQRQTIGSKEVLFVNHIKVAGKQTQILSNENNRLRIVDCLIKRLNQENIRVVQAEYKSDRIICKDAVIAAKNNGSKNVVIVGDEIDLLVLLIHHGKSNNIFMLRPGKKTTKTSHIAVIQSALGNAKENILTINAISGTPNISAFYKKGKVSFLKNVLSNSEIASSLKIFNKPNADVGKLLKAGEKLLLSVYGATKSTKDINSLRYELFNKINR